MYFRHKINSRSGSGSGSGSGSTDSQSLRWHSQSAGHLTAKLGMAITWLMVTSGSTWNKNRAVNTTGDDCEQQVLTVTVTLCLMTTRHGDRPWDDGLLGWQHLQWSDVKVAHEGVLMLRAIDRSALSIDRAAPCMDLLLAQASIDGATIDGSRSAIDR